MKLIALAIVATLLFGSLLAQAEEPTLPTELSELRRQVKLLSERVAQLEQQLRDASERAAPAASVWRTPDGRAITIRQTPVIGYQLPLREIVGDERSTRYMRQYAPDWREPKWDVEAGMKLDAIERKIKSRSNRVYPR